MAKRLTSVLNRSRSSSANSIKSQEEDVRPYPIDANVIDVTQDVEMRSVDGDTEDVQYPESDHESTFGDTNFLYTQNHPLGQIFLGLFKDTFNLAKKTNQKEMESDLAEVCENFNKAMRLIAKTTQKQIEKATKNFEVHLIQKELNSHLINEHSDPPKKFSPFPTIISAQAKNDAMRSFPTKSPKFSGLPPSQGGIDVVEFLSSLNMAQEYCNLTEKEFKQMLLLCTTGRAHTLMAEWIRLDESVPTIYHNLLTNFDKRMTPQTAQDLLFTYKAPKTLTLREVETNLMLWASRASTSLPEGPARKAFYNMQIIQAIIRSLPPQSSARVQSVFNTLSARLGRAATATELSKALNLDRHSIDIDIKMHGADRHQNSSAGTFNDKQRSFSRKGYNKRNGGVSGMKNKTHFTSFSVSAEKNFPSPWTSPQQNDMSKQMSFHSANNSQNATTMRRNPQQSGNFTNRNPYHDRNFNFVNKERTRPNPYPHSNPMRQHSNGNPRFSRRDQNNRPAYTYMQNAQPRGISNNRRNFQSRPNMEQNYCSLCGKRDHRASQGCKYMVTDSGSKVNIMPTHTLCGACPAHVSPRLNHPSMLCPYRVGGPFSQNHSSNPQRN